MSWVSIKEGEPYGQFGANHKEFQISSASDISNPPSDAIAAAPGSKAYLDDMSRIWNKGNDGTWKEVVI